ncbi:MAG: hypothetical protein JWN86_4334 [Planctomycetota bacterium]|nr:hypothetical protein [Planctomycetota bacterium]
MAFDLLPRSRQAVIPLGPAFRHAGLKAVGAVGDAVDGDRPEHVSVEGLAVTEAAVCPQGD